MVAEVAHLVARDAAPERIWALIRMTISEIEYSFTTIDRLQARTRLALAVSLLEADAQTSPRFGRPTTVLRAELRNLDVEWFSCHRAQIPRTSALVRPACHRFSCSSHAHAMKCATFGLFTNEHKNEWFAKKSPPKRG